MTSTITDTDCFTVIPGNLLHLIPSAAQIANAVSSFDQTGSHYSALTVR